MFRNITPLSTPKLHFESLVGGFVRGFWLECWWKIRLVGNSAMVFWCVLWTRISFAILVSATIQQNRSNTAIAFHIAATAARKRGSPNSKTFPIWPFLHGPATFWIHGYEGLERPFKFVLEDLAKVNAVYLKASGLIFDLWVTIYVVLLRGLIKFAAGKMRSFFESSGSYSGTPCVIMRLGVRFSCIP